MKEIIQQLITLTQELFKATGGIEEIEELLVSMGQNSPIEKSGNDVTTLADYKEQLKTKIEDTTFREIYVAIGGKGGLIDKVEAAYYSLKAIYEEYKELKEDLATYNSFLSLYKTYLK